LELKDFVNKEAVEKLEEAIISNKAIIAFGSAGTGKTTSVYVIAKAHGYEVIETNASNERNKEKLSIVCDIARSKGMNKMIVLLDEADGIKDWSGVKKILSSAIHPVVLTANDEWKIPEDVKSICVKVRFFPIPLQEIVKEARKHAGTLHFQGITTGDMRNGVLSAIYGGDGYNPSDNFKRVEQIFGNTLPEDLDKDDIHWLVDNVPRFYTGSKIVDVLELLSWATKYSRLEMLSALPKGKGRAAYPYFFKRMKVMRSEKKSAKSK